MNSKHFTLSLVATFVLLVLGTFAYYYLDHRYEHYKIVTTSSIVQEDKTKTKTNTTEPEKNTLKSIIYDSQKAVVQIQVKSDNTETIGSGFLYNDQGDIITNAHVVEGAKYVTVKTSDAQTYKGTVIGKGTQTDIAVVRVPNMASQEPLPIQTKDTTEIGDEVIALGSPLGFQNTVTTGIISGTDRQFTIDPYTYDNVYQVSAPITHGNSGGPLISKKTGEVIAINAAGMEEGNIAFSIPVTDIIDQVKQWSTSPETVTGFDGTVGEHSNTAENSQTLQSDAEYLVNYYYESLNSHDYVAAYALLGNDWQEKTDYKNFREGYIQTIQTTVDSITSNISDDGKQATVLATITALEQTDDGNKETTEYKVTYKVGYENDQLRLFSGKGEQITEDNDK